MKHIQTFIYIGTYRNCCLVIRFNDINALRQSDAYMRQQTRPSLFQIMAWRLTGSKPWTNAGILLIGRLGTNFSDISIEIHTFRSRKSIRKYHMAILNWHQCINGRIDVVTASHDAECSTAAPITEKISEFRRRALGRENLRQELLHKISKTMQVR